MVGDFPYHTAIYTNTADIFELEHLLQALPDVAFHVLAHSHFGFNLVKLEQYPNLILYPSFDPLTSRKVLEKIDFYMDINPFDEVDHITETIHSWDFRFSLLKEQITTKLGKIKCSRMTK